MKVKNLILLLFIITCYNHVFAQKWVSITSDRPGKEVTRLVSSNNTSTVISVSMGGFWLEPVQTPRGEAFIVSADGSTPILEEGSPDLPKLTTSLIIPDDQAMEVVIMDMKYTDFPGMDIAPSKGNLSREIDPSTVGFRYGQVYNINEFYPSQLAFMRQPFILRDHRGQTVVVNQFAYNPVTKILRVYHELTLQVKVAAGASSNIYKRKTVNNTLTNDFKTIYERQFLNSQSSYKYAQVMEQGRMLVICHDDFEQQMQPFIEWKKQTGMPVELVKASSTGASAQSIKQYVEQHYKEKGLTYLLLVGDNQHIPAMTNEDLGGPSDMAYSYLAGNDHYPDIFVGRFSAEDEEEVAIQVQRTISYEKNPDGDSDWLSKGVGIASSEGPGDEEEYDWEHIRNIRSYLMRYTYNEVTELYDGDRGFKDMAGDPGPATLASELNQGRGIINYTGHGNEMSWGTTGFNITHVNSLANTSKWPFIIAVACLNGDFIDKTCFAESWLRASKEGSPTGAVAALMATINQSWDPPMCAQDEMTKILTESIQNNVKRTFGGVAVNGCLKMNDSYGVKGTTMTDTWVIFGDPSLQIRTSSPSLLKVTHDNHITVGSDVLTVHCNTNGALACLTLNGAILGTEVVNNGVAVINFPVIKETGTVKLTVTAYNFVPYVEEIEISRVDSPYITFNSVQINDSLGNNNQSLDFGEKALVSLLLSNVGNETVKDVSVRISSTDKYISILDAQEVYPSIKASETVSLKNAFEIHISKDVPDKHFIEFNFTATSGNQDWSGKFKIVAHSFVLEYIAFTIDDSNGNKNGRADRGETVNILINLKNTGGAAVQDINCSLEAIDPGLIIQESKYTINEIESNQYHEVKYRVTALATANEGQTVHLKFTCTALNGFSINDTIALVIGRKPVLVIDLDGNKNSGPEISKALNQVGISHDYVTTWPQSLDSYKSLFICLGTFPYLTQLSSIQGQQVANFLNNKNSVYMEGGDVWSYDVSTAAQPLFKIKGDTDGAGDLNMIIGKENTFMKGLSFNFAGDNKYIDRLLPVDSSFAIAGNSSPEYHTTIAYNNGSYFTIGSSFEFGGLVDNLEAGISKQLLISKYVDFLEINALELEASFMAVDSTTCLNNVIEFRNTSTGTLQSLTWTFAGGVPSESNESNPVIRYDQTGYYDVILTVSDGSRTFTTVKSNYIHVDNCTSIIDDITNDAFKIFPNPAKGNINVIIPDNSSFKEITILNAYGNQVYNDKITRKVFNIELKGLTTGIYYVILTNENGRASHKFVVIN